MSAAATKMPARQRLAAIKANVRAIMDRLPSDWNDWSAEQTRRYKHAASALQLAGSVPKALAAAGTLAEFHGVPMSSIDPEATP